MSEELETKAPIAISLARNLEEKITYYSETLTRYPPGHQDRFSSLNSLANVLLARYMQLGRADDLNEAITYHREALTLIPTGHPYRSISLNNLGMALHILFKQSRRMEDLHDAIAYHREALTLYPIGCSTEINLQPDRSTSLRNLANAIFTRYEQSGSMEDLEEVITYNREALTLRPPDHPERSTTLDDLGIAVLIRCDQSDYSSMKDFEEGITYHRETLRLRPPGHPHRSISLTNLVNAFYTRYKQLGIEEDVEMAITYSQEALTLCPPGHPNRFNSLHNHACVVLTRYEKSGSLEDLEDVISYNREALALRPPGHPGRSKSLNSLAHAVLSRYKQLDTIKDLDNAIEHFNEAITLCPSRHPDRPTFLDNLGSALVTRYHDKQSGRVEDLENAIKYNHEALTLRPSGHPYRHFSLTNLGNALSDRYKRLGSMDDLNNAMEYFDEALTLCPFGHPYRSASLNNLGNALITRYKHSGHGTMEDIDNAIGYHREVLKLCSESPGHPDQEGLILVTGSNIQILHSTLLNLGYALLTRFGERSQQSDLDEAIFLHRQALELFPLPHPGFSLSLNNLASALQTRFEQRGQKNDLDEKIDLLRQAVKLQLPHHPNLSLSLNNLANALLTRFTQRGPSHEDDPDDLVDLDEAISLHRQYLALCPLSHPQRSIALHNLACSLQIGFEQRRDENDLDEMIDLLRQALKDLNLQLPPHPNLYRYMNSLANALLTRFDLSQKNDLEEAISFFKQALDIRPPPHPSRSLSLSHLAHALSVKFAEGGQQIDLEEAMSRYRAATKCLFQPPSRLLDIAKKWILDAKMNEHISVIDAYDTALQALPQVAALSFDVQSRQEALAADSDGLARDASICAILTGDLDKAIEFLEAGRSVFWTQILSLRSPFNQLHDVDPKLASRMQEIATALELGSHRDASIETLDNRQKLSEDQEVSRLNRLSEEWAKSIDHVRTLEGFEDFLRPARLSSLRTATSRYPVVFLVPSHCLVMTSTSVHHIPLPKLDVPVLKALVHLVQGAVHRLPISRSFFEVLLRGDRGTREVNLGSSNDVFRHVLKKLWDELVKPVIKFLDIKKSTESSKMPILQWCPTGHFTFLPIHAAGNYYDEQNIECAADYFISSYTPTVGALRAHPPASSSRTFKMMVVVQTKELPSAKTELEKIQRHIPSDALAVFGIPGAVANVETVASCLSEASILHFACHGMQDRLKPLNSGLKLDDGLLRISRIIKEKSFDGSLAFLCACETAMGDKKLPDEAMSLGASLLFSGFHSVIATMWKMLDEDGPIIADAFYEELFRGPDAKPVLEPDTTKSAQALHDAVKKLRSQNASFVRWIPFIHIGK